MTGRVVERDGRTAYRSASTASTGGSALMPPHSQGAERRTEHRAGRTGSRWGLRALVIGGPAGAARLRTGAAARTPDRDPADEGFLGSSLVGSEVDDQHSIPVVDRVLHAAAQPLDFEDHRVRSVVAFPPATVTHEENDAGSALRRVDSVLLGLTAPLRLSGEAVDTARPVAGLAGQVVDTDEEEPAAVRQRDRRH